MTPEARPVSASAIDGNIRHVFPRHMNMLGTIFGGKLLSWADELAGAVAFQHIQGPCLAVWMDGFPFLGPVYAGDNLIMSASVNCTWTTSLEVGVKCWAQNPITKKQRHIFSTYFVLVGLDSDHRPVPVPPIIPETDEHRRRCDEASRRRLARLSQKK